MARLPPNVRQQHSLIMDPTGTVKSAMSGRSRRQAGPHPSLHGRNAPWPQESFSSGHGSGAGGSVRGPAGRPPKPTLVIPRAKVTSSRGYSNSGFSDEEGLSGSEVQRNRGVSERSASLASRQRRRSVPSFAGLLGGRRREGSVDPLLEGFQSDGGESAGRQSNSTFHRSVSRGDLDAMDR